MITTDYEVIGPHYISAIIYLRLEFNYCTERKTENSHSFYNEIFERKTAEQDLRNKASKSLLKIFCRVVIYSFVWRSFRNLPSPVWRADPFSVKQIHHGNILIDTRQIRYPTKMARYEQELSLWNQNGLIRFDKFTQTGFFSVTFPEYLSC